MELKDYVPLDPEDGIWDVVVVGTGAGGGTAGLNLARSGRSVLFLERGKLDQHAKTAAGGPSETQARGGIEAGWWPHDVERKGKPGSASQAAIGCGVGGSTAFFGMVMDRLRPVDFSPRCFAQKVPETSLPDAWPIGYRELEPYYQRAERLFRVRGTQDPLTSVGGALLEPLPPSDVEAAINQTLRQAGMHPYRLHSASERIPGCDGCFRRRCLRACRNDSGRICVIPALENHGAHILPGCRVVRLDAKGRSVCQAACVLDERHVTIRARAFVLALNALLTPALLLRSANTSFPDGLGNSSGMVGRNLMFHVLDSLLVRFGGLHGPLNARLNHGLSVNDFYVRDGVKLGNVQTHAADLGHLLGEGDLEGLASFFTILEDFPYLANRVTPKGGSDDGVCWEYRYPDELRCRRKSLIEAFVDSLRPIQDVSVRRYTGDLNIPHACGTCRFGNDPRTSVLNRDNRVHDLDNVYIVDASFFPSSGGINPSLTIVANSLRVSDIIAKS